MGHCDGSHYAAAAASQRGRAIAAQASKASRDRLKDEQQHGGAQGQGRGPGLAGPEHAGPSLSPTGGTSSKGGSKGGGAVPWTAATVTRLSGAPSPSSKGYY